MNPSLRHALRPAITALAVGSATALVACGGSDSSSEDEQASFDDAQVEFAQCMRENGVDIPDPEPGEDGFGFQIGEGGVDPGSEDFQQAQEQCGEILQDAIPEGERPDSAETEDQLLELTQCLRDEGYDLPDPQLADFGSGGGPPETDSGEMEQLQELMGDPEFQQAQEDCMEETGVELGGPGGPTDGG